MKFHRLHQAHVGKSNILRSPVGPTAEFGDQHYARHQIRRRIFAKLLARLQRPKVETS